MQDRDLRIAAEEAAKALVAAAELTPEKQFSGRKLKAIYIPLAAILFCLCAYAVIPGLRLNSGSGQSVDVSYPSAQLKDNTLTIVVEYDSAGAFFEIGRDIVVATDRDFSAQLRRSGSTVEGNRYIHQYLVKGAVPETLYIKPPILYIPTEIDAVTVPLRPVDDAPVDAWLTVSAIDAKEAAEGMYTILVTVTANTADLPRFPRLVVGDRVIGGAAALNFDEDGNFASGVFQYDVKADSKEAALTQVANANIVVENALLRVDSSKLRIGSDVQSVTVVVVD